MFPRRQGEEAGAAESQQFKKKETTTGRVKSEITFLGVNAAMKIQTAGTLPVSRVFGERSMGLHTCAEI